MDLVQECCKIITEAAQVASFRTTTQQRDEKKKRYEAARAEGKDFIVVVQLGKALKAAEAELSQHPLSEEGYLTLAERHDALVDKVTAKCQQLMKEEDLDALEVLATKLAELKALDLSTLPKSWANDPVQASSNPVQLESLPKSIDDWRFPVFSDLEDWTQTPVSFAKDVSIPTYAPCSLTCQAEEQDGFMDDPVMPPADAVFSPAFPVESAKFDDWADFASFS